MDHILKSEVLVVVLRTSKGLPFSEFAQLFHHIHGYPLSLSQYGYHSLCQLLDDMNDVIVVMDDATQGLVIKNRYLSRHLFLLVAEDGSLVQERPYLLVQDHIAAPDRAGGQPGFNTLLKTEDVSQNNPVLSFLSNPLESCPVNGHLEFPVLPQQLPQSLCGSYNPVLQPIFVPKQQTANQNTNCHVSVPKSKPLNQKTGVMHRASNQSSRCPTPNMAGLDYQCKKALLPDLPSRQSTGTLLYSNIVAGTRQENSLPCSTTMNVPVAYNTDLDTSTIKEETSQLTLTTSNFPHLTGQSRNVPKKRVSDLSKQCQSKVLGSISGESQSDDACNVKSISGHSNTNSAKPNTTEQLAGTSDRFQCTMKTQMLNSHNLKLLSNNSEVNPKRATISPELKKNILGILEQHPSGMSIGQFKSAYLCTFNRLLPLNGYPSALELLADLDDVVRIQGLGIQMLLFPNSSNKALDTATMKHDDISSEEVDVSLTKDDVCYGNISQDAKIPKYLNRTLISPPFTQPHVASAGIAFLASTLPSAYITPAFSPMTTIQGANCMIPNSNFPAATYPPCTLLRPPPLLPPPLFPHPMGFGVSPQYQDHFSEVSLPLGPGYHVPLSSQKLMFNRFPSFGSFSYTASPPLAFAAAFSPVPAFAAPTLIYPPMVNPFQVAAVPPVYPSLAQTLQQTVEHQSEEQCTRGDSCHAPPQPLLFSTPSEPHLKETQLQKHISEAKKTIAQETVNISFTQLKASPPVQRVLPLCSISKLEDIKPEVSDDENSDRNLSSRIYVDSRGLSDELSLPRTEPLKQEWLYQECTILETTKEKTHFETVTQPTCKSEEAFLSKNELSEIGDQWQEIALSESSKDRLGAKSILNSKGLSETLGGSPELPKSDMLYCTDDSLIDTLNNKAICKSTANPTGDAERSSPLTEAAEEDFDSQDSVWESIKALPGSETVALSIPEKVTPSLSPNGLSQMELLNPDLFLHETSSDKAESASKQIASRLPITEPSKAESPNMVACLPSPRNEVLGCRPVVDTSWDSETSSEDSSSESFLEANRTTSLSGTGEAVHCELPMLAAVPNDTESPNSELCQIL